MALRQSLTRSRARPGPGARDGRCGDDAAACGRRAERPSAATARAHCGHRAGLSTRHGETWPGRASPGGARHKFRWMVPARALLWLPSMASGAGPRNGASKRCTAQLRSRHAAHRRSRLQHRSAAARGDLGSARRRPMCSRLQVQRHRARARAAGSCIPRSSSAGRSASESTFNASSGCCVHAAESAPSFTSSSLPGRTRLGSPTRGQENARVPGAEARSTSPGSAPQLHPVRG